MHPTSAHRTPHTEEITMSSVPAAPVPGHVPAAATAYATTAAPTRPRVLVAALATSAAVAGLTVLSHALVLAGGQGAVRESVLGELPADASSFPALVDTAVEQAMDTLRTRAWVGIAVAVVVLLLTAAAARAGRVARTALALSLALSALLMLRSVTDLFPGGAEVPGTLAVLLAPVAVVLLFLPPVGRYRAARRRS
jgi:hypothetical protein